MKDNEELTTAKIILMNDSGRITVTPPSALSGINSFTVKVLENNIVDVDLTEIYKQLTTTSKHLRKRWRFWNVI